MTFKSIAEFLDPKNGHSPTPAERQLIDATRAGTRCTLSETRPTEPTDETRIRAPLLRLLILGGTPACGLHERGVTLIGGWIEGRLDLAYCTARGQTVLNFCQFQAQPNLAQSSLQLLSLDGSAFPGLFAQGARIAGSLLLHRATATRRINVGGAQIGGQLACDDALFDGQGQEALLAQGMETKQDALLRRIRVSGSVDLSSAHIGGQLSCIGARFHGMKGVALRAQALTAEKSVFLRDIMALGSVNLNSAQIGGQLDCSGSIFDGVGNEAFYAQRMQVAQSFLFRQVNAIGTVELTAARVGDLVDDLDSWPSSNHLLVLDGFIYDRIDGSPPLTSFVARRNWLKAGSIWNGHFSPQPYTQLARVLHQMGHQAEARKVMIERTKLLGQHARNARKVKAEAKPGAIVRSIWFDFINSLAFAFDRLSLWIAGYGHAPLRSLGWLIALFFAASLIAQQTWATGAFAPNSDVLLTSPGWAQVTANDCLPEPLEGCDPNPAQTWANTFTATAATPTQGADWESFSAFAYAADLVVPVLDFGQTDAWAPSRDRGAWGRLLWWSRWLFEVMGWLVSGLGIAAVTGVMQRNQPD